MLSWEHSGLNVWSGEPFTDPDTRRFLRRYLKKSRVSLERMSIRDDSQIGITRIMRTVRWPEKIGVSIAIAKAHPSHSNRRQHIEIFGETSPSFSVTK